MTESQSADSYSETEIEIDLGALDSTEAPDTELNLDFGDDDAEAGDDIEIDLAGVDDEPEPVASEPDADGEAALEELRTTLRTQAGDWYVIHTYSGMENRVKQNLDARITTLGMEDYIFESIVPTEDVVEIRNGQRKNVTRTSHPGYVLVRMDLTNESWSAVRQTPSVTGFVGQGTHPVPLTLEEVERMLAPAVIAKATAAAAGASAPKKRKVEVADFNVGDSVMVVQGPFSGVHATITDINANNQRLKALVEILGRETPVELSFAQVQKG
ncbi:transcription termination/antitermination protein NusG [Propioniciclava sp.]|uniref:transcription termination/antitermination protein NusG n=1 Tax=Propioniciclava sp. TaxID=2038686 RepID=UPI002608F48B|nr:transcription termination/antitermination protein NusG [Propioniciclava sp.]